MLILRSICLVLVILGSSHSYHVNDNWNNDKDKNLADMTLKRQQRSVTSILDYTLGAISLTGVRVAYYLEQIWFDKFGDEQKVSVFNLIWDCHQNPPAIFSGSQGRTG